MSIESWTPGSGILPIILTPVNILRLLGLWMLYRLSLAIYNVSPLHPLYHFPGPKLASMTFLYEFWYDMVLTGQYTMRIKAMHERYGMDMVLSELRRVQR